MKRAIPLLSLLSIISTNAHTEDQISKIHASFELKTINEMLSAPPLKCTSVSCELYTEEQAKLKVKLAAINCLGTGEQIKNCDQIAFAKVVKEFQEKTIAVFAAPNVAKKVKDDAQYNAKTNRFTAKTQNAPGVYELISVLSDANIGIHSGQVVNYQPAVDRIVAIDPSGGDVSKSNWYLAQWKKESPLMLNKTRQDPIITNSGYVDGYLGRPKFEINSPIDPKYGVETSLLIYKDPVDDSNVFEIVSRNGYLNDVGGSNVFLSSPLTNDKYAAFSNGIYLSYNGKLSRLKANKFPSAGKNDVAIGSAFTGFTAYYNPPGGGPGTNLFIQLNIADSRKENITHYACYMHGEGVEIVSTLNVDGDFLGEVTDPKAPLEAKKYSLNKYLCHSLKRNYKCPAEYKGAVISSTGNDLSRWSITGLYTGLETQVARGAGQDGTRVGPVAGEVEVGMQYSNLRLSSNTNEKFLSCDDVFKKEADEEALKCKKGTFKADDGKTIEYSCGCGEVSGGVKQNDGCYHRVVTGQSTPETKDPNCKMGSFKNAEGKEVEFFCGCGEISGGVKQNDGCYHKLKGTPSFVSLGVAGITETHEQLSSTSASAGNFCNSGKRTYWFCSDKGEKPSSGEKGWTSVGDGCYHRASNESCQ